MGLRLFEFALNKLRFNVFNTYESKSIEMKSGVKKILNISMAVLFVATINTTNAQPDGAAIYNLYCATCHGADLRGGNGTSLVDGIWQFGAAESYKFRNIKFGIPHLGMPSYGGILKDD